MVNYNLHKDTNKEICCNGYGCYENATIKIDVPAGTFGIISLELCSSCIKKFQLPKENVQVNQTSSTKTSSIPNNNHSYNSITFSKNKQYLSQRNE